MVHAQKVVLEILWQITKPRSKNVFKKWVLCDENKEIIAAVPQAGTRPPGQPDQSLAKGSSNGSSLPWITTSDCKLILIMQLLHWAQNQREVNLCLKAKSSK